MFLCWDFYLRLLISISIVYAIVGMVNFSYRPVLIQSNNAIIVCVVHVEQDYKTNKQSKKVYQIIIKSQDFTDKVEEEAIRRMLKKILE